jgi:CxxC-x17-CxxC domain-containing protein
MKRFDGGQGRRKEGNRAGDARPGGYRSEGYGGFSKRRTEGKFSGGFRRGPPGERPRLELHKAVCAKCGQQCEVPFKPTTAKPVYCRDCFQKEDSGGRPPQRSDGLDRINEKLDKIMKALNIE